MNSRSIKITLTIVIIIVIAVLGGLIYINYKSWKKTSFDISNSNYTVEYSEKRLHPFLSDSDRKIYIKNKVNKKENILVMPPNYGGKTLINVYIEQNASINNKETDVLTLFDRWTVFSINLSDLKPLKDEYSFNKNPNNIKYLGRISWDRKELIFLPEEKASKIRFNSHGIKWWELN